MRWTVVSAIANCSPAKRRNWSLHEKSLIRAPNQFIGAFISIKQSRLDLRGSHPVTPLSTKWAGGTVIFYKSNKNRLWARHLLRSERSLPLLFWSSELLKVWMRRLLLSLRPPILWMALSHVPWVISDMSLDELWFKQSWGAASRSWPTTKDVALYWEDYFAKLIY